MAVLSLRAGDRVAVRQILARIDPALLTSREKRVADALARQSQPMPRWRFDGGLGLQPATNPGKKTSARRVTLGGLDFTLNPDARAEAETGLSAQASAIYTHPLGRDLDIQGDVSGRALLYSDPALNEGRLIVRTGPVWRADRSTRLHAFARAEARWRGGDLAHEALGIGLSAQRRIALRSVGFASLGLDRYDVARSTTRDGDQRALVAGLSYTATQRLRLTPSVVVLRYDAKAAQHARTEVTLRGRVDTILPGGQRLQVQLALGRARHDAAGGLDPEARRDRSGQASLRLEDARLRIGAFQPVLAMDFEKTISNNPLNSFESLSAGISVEWRGNR